MENTQQKQRKGGKLCDRWLGPYTVNRNLGKGVYELRNSSGRVLKTKCNIARLKVMVSAYIIFIMYLIPIIVPFYTVIIGV